ncbi:MAG: pyrroline-5-carboxylate reductase [Desulfobulbaceae bacterium]|nr:pyrroline-5-carboxylate reductase [Desulfobulbaceae bacterium]
MDGFDSVGLVGGGQMGEALVRGMIGAGLLKADNVMIAEPDGDRRIYLRKTYSVKVTEDADELVRFSSILILAVKPQIMGKVLEQYKKLITGQHLIISIAAGVTIKSMEMGLGENVKIVRVMPNTPALVLAGASALSPNARVTTEEMEAALQIFSAVGTCVQVNESLLDAVTGLSGSGPGYVFTFIEAMIDGGVLAGLPRPVAEKLVLQTVYGSARLAMETGEAPAVLKGRVTSPGGTTISGLHVLEESGFRGTVMSAIDAAAQRSRELGE